MQKIKQNDIELEKFKSMLKSIVDECIVCCVWSRHTHTMMRMNERIILSSFNEL